MAIANGIHVACAAEERYAPHCAAMLQSLLSYHPADVTLHFLHGPELSPQLRQRLAGLVARDGSAIRFHEIPDRLVAGLPTLPRIPPLMWYRIFLPQLLPELDRALYLDADTLITDRLDELWQTPLGDCYVAAVTNVVFPKDRDAVCALGIDPSKYFNSGVLLMNLALMRKHGCTDAIRAHGLRHAHLRFPDQDSLNVVLGRRRRELHPRWNCMNSFFYFAESHALFPPETLEDARRRPAILHFEGPDHFKPWHFLNEHPFRRLYQERLRESGWSVPWPEGLTVRNIALRYLPKALHPPLRSAMRWLNGKRPATDAG